MRLTGIQGRHITFGYSIVRECIRAIDVVLHPAQHAEQMPWVRSARRLITTDLRARMRYFEFFFSPQVEMFPFVWRDHKRRPLADDLQALRRNEDAYRDTVLRRLSGKPVVTASDLRKMRSSAWLRRAVKDYALRFPSSTEMLRAFVKSPAASAGEFADMLERFHDVALQAAWGPIDAQLQSDIRMRRVVLEKYGVAPLLRTLSDDLNIQRLKDGVVFEAGPGDADIAAGVTTRILLTPSFFIWPHVHITALKTPAGLHATVAYPIPPLPARSSRSMAHRAGLVNACRAAADPVRIRILELLAGRDLSTRELAGFLKITEPAVSRHLTILQKGELVRKRRNGYFVMYELERERLHAIADDLAAIGGGRAVAERAGG